MPVVQLSPLLYALFAFVKKFLESQQHTVIMVITIIILDLSNLISLPHFFHSDGCQVDNIALPTYNTS